MRKLIDLLDDEDHKFFSYGRMLMLLGSHRRCWAMIRCGENSLAIYCVGVLLSFVGFVMLRAGGRPISAVAEGRLGLRAIAPGLASI